MPNKGKPKKPAAKPRAVPSKGPAKPRDRRTSQPRYAEAALLRSQILELRTLGLTLEQIAQRVNRAKSVVHTHLQNALGELDQEQREASDKLRALAYARLEKILARAMLGAVKGDVKCMREAQRLIAAQQRLMGWGTLAKVNPETGEPLGDGTGLPPGHWTLPMRPAVSIEQWQAEAEKSWQDQLKREAQAND